MAGFYCTYLCNFSSVVSLLTELLGKTTTFTWTPCCEYAFETVKLLFSRATVLVAPHLDESCTLHVDVRGIGAGAVLSQVDAAGIEWR